MQDTFINAITNGLYGRFTHIDPQEALAGLTAELARKKPHGRHSCWEILHHVVVWQETFLAHIEGRSPNWREVEETINWPTPAEMAEDADFENLMTRFQESIERIKKLLPSVDFTQIPPGEPALSIGQLFIALLQHLSYHIGQISTVKQLI